MARIWRKPGALMAAYVVLYAIMGAQPGTKHWATTSQLTADAVGVAIAAIFAWRVARGGAVSRILCIVWTIGFLNRAFVGRDGPTSGSLIFGYLAINLAQLALLVSTPIYERTRGDWADRPPSSGRMWPVPPWWFAVVALAGGLLFTLISLASMDGQHVPGCVSNGSQCATLARGYPEHFLSAIPVDSGRAAYAVLNAGAAAENVAVWTVLSFAACYLIWLPSRRPAEAATAPMAAPV